MSVSDVLCGLGVVGGVVFRVRKRSVGSSMSCVLIVVLRSLLVLVILCIKL